MPLYEPPFHVADKEVSAYSEVEQAQLKEAFASQEKQRPWMLALVFLIGYPLVPIAGGLAMTPVTRLFKDPGAGGLGLAVSLVVVIPLMGCLHRFQQRKCTACRHDVDHSAGPFCPCCGKRTLSHYGKHPTCADCGAVLKWNQWVRSHPREFRLHTCPVCGVKLSDGGVE